MESWCTFQTTRTFSQNKEFWFYDLCHILKVIDLKWFVNILFGFVLVSKVDGDIVISKLVIGSRRYIFNDVVSWWYIFWGYQWKHIIMWSWVLYQLGYNHIWLANNRKRGYIHKKRKLFLQIMKKVYYDLNIWVWIQTRGLV